MNSYDSVNEKTQRIDIALKYTDGDMDSAKLMVSGKLDDIVVIKGKFFVPEEDKSGLFFAFVNIEKNYIAAMRSLVAQGDNLFTKIRIFDEWSSLFTSMLSYAKDGEGSSSSQIENSLRSNFLSGNLFSQTANKNLDHLSNFIQGFIQKYFEDGDARTQIEFEDTNSVEVATRGIEITGHPGGTSRESKSQGDGESEFQKKLKEIESEAQAVVEGNSVLSPVKGKFVDQVSPGDKIYVSLPGKDGLTEKIVDAYNARDHEGNALPVPGRIVHKVPNQGQGYVIYVLVAKGIYAKMIEEENVKLRMDWKSSSPTSTEKKSPEEEESSKGFGSIFFYLLFVVFVIVLIVVIALL